jgi:hypothetical protein
VEWAGTNAKSRQRSVRLAVAAVFAMVVAWFPLPGVAQSVSDRDLQVLGRAVGFLRPELPAEAIVAIAFDAANPSSRRDAEAIADRFGEGVRGGGVLLRPRLVAVNDLAAERFSVVIAAVGASGPQVMAATRTAHALCVTGDLAAVRAGLCTMTIQTGPRVEIWVNHEAAAAAGIDFAAAFRMMVREF